jgi:hypothetical protein
LIDNNVIGVKTLDDRNALFELFGKLLGDGYHLVYVNGAGKEHNLERWDFGLERTVLFLQLLNHMEARKEWGELATERHEWGTIIGDGVKFKTFMGRLRERLSTDRGWVAQYDGVIFPEQNVYSVMWDMLSELVTLPINERIAIIRDLHIPCFCSTCWKRAPFFLLKKWCRYVFKSFVRRCHKQ